jgi:hypothetical protein
VAAASTYGCTRPSSPRLRADYFPWIKAWIETVASDWARPFQAYSDPTVLAGRERLFGQVSSATTARWALAPERLLGVLVDNRPHVAYGVLIGTGTETSCRARRFRGMAAHAGVVDAIGYASLVQGVHGQRLATHAVQPASPAMTSANVDRVDDPRLRPRHPRHPDPTEHSHPPQLNLAPISLNRRAQSDAAVSIQALSREND